MIYKKKSKDQKILLLHTRPTLNFYYETSEKNLRDLEELIIQLRGFQMHFVNYLLDIKLNPRPSDYVTDKHIIIKLLISHDRLICKLNGTIKKHLQLAYLDSYNLIINSVQDEFFFKELASRTNPDKIYATWGNWDKHVRRLAEKNNRIFSIAQLLIKKRFYQLLNFFFVHRKDKELGYIYPFVREFYFSIKPDLKWQQQNTK